VFKMGTLATVQQPKPVQTRPSSGAVAPVAPSKSAAPAPTTYGADVSQTNWDGAVLKLSEIIGVEVNDDAQGTRQVEPKPLKGTSGKFVEQQIGWWANKQKIVLVRRRREAMPLPNGQFQSVGSWLPPKFVEYQAIGNPVVRTKNVPIDSAGLDESGTQTQQVSTPGATQNPLEKFDHALWNIRYLPEEVRQRMVTRVPTPTVFEAAAIRCNGGAYFTVKAVIINGTRAMVTVAALQKGSTTWQVEMSEYELAPTSNTLPLAVKTQQLGRLP
jgi:hypothetical protein